MTICLQNRLPLVYFFLDLLLKKKVKNQHFILKSSSKKNHKLKIIHYINTLKYFIL